MIVYLLPPEDGGGCDPPALHADLHPVPPDRPPDHRGHPVSVTTNNVIQIMFKSNSYLSVEVHTRVCESSRKLKILVTLLRSG